MAAINTLEASKRIVIKIGSGLIVDSNGSVRHNWLDNFVSDVTKLRESKKEIIIVTSGAVALGRNLLGINKNIKRKKRFSYKEHYYFSFHPEIFHPPTV